jgi:starch phosphorylase
LYVTASDITSEFAHPLGATHPLALAPVTGPASSVDGFVRQFLRNLNYERGVALSASTSNDRYIAFAMTVRDYLMARWLEDQKRQRMRRRRASLPLRRVPARAAAGQQPPRDGLSDIASEAMAACGIDIDDLRAHEVEPGLGNGGLGRLAACFIDSLATLGVPNIGYGIRYEYGIFRQTFEDGQQVEQPDAWLKLGSPWEFPTPRRRAISFGGHTETYDDAGTRRTLGAGVGRPRRPVQLHGPGYLNGRVNTLRLWSAKATNSFDLRVFNSGDYEEAVRAQTFAENISKVLYPEDSTPQGKELRLQQQYFFVAASIGDFLESLPEDFDLTSCPTASSSSSTTPPGDRRPRTHARARRREADGVGCRVGDHPAVLRLHVPHLLPEALEVWSVDLLGRLLPRHLEIIYRINEEFLAEVRERFGDDEMRIRNMSIIGEFPDRSVRMAYLATVAGAKVNGVAELHSQLLRDKVLPDFNEFYPGKFTNVTNGVTPRRFVRLANPGLSALITEAIGTGWVTDLERCASSRPTRKTRSSAPRSPRSRRRTSAASATRCERATVSRSATVTCSTSWSSVCTSTSGRC